LILQLIFVYFYSHFLNTAAENVKALGDFLSAAVPLRSYSLTHSVPSLPLLAWKSRVCRLVQCIARLPAGCRQTAAFWCIL